MSIGSFPESSSQAILAGIVLPLRTSRFKHIRKLLARKRLGTRWAEYPFSFHNFKSQNFKLSVSNPKSTYVAYVSVLSQFSNCQSLGRKNKHGILKTDRSKEIGRSFCMLEPREEYKMLRLIHECRSNLQSGWIPFRGSSVEIGTMLLK